MLKTGTKFNLGNTKVFLSNNPSVFKSKPLVEEEIIDLYAIPDSEDLEEIASNLEEGVLERIIKGEYNE